VIDAKTKQVVAPPHSAERQPEYFAYDEKEIFFINLEDSHSIAVVDACRKKLKALGRWLAVRTVRLALDRKTHTLFSSCDGKLMVVDSQTAKAPECAIGDDFAMGIFDREPVMYLRPPGGKLSIIHADKSASTLSWQEIDTPPDRRPWAWIQLRTRLSPIPQIHR